MKYLALLLVLAAFSSCSIISHQYYYVPSVAHQTIKQHYGHSDFRMIYSRIKITSQAGDSIGSVTTSNGIGHALLMGPFLPFFPVGGFFQKSSTCFTMDISVSSNTGFFMPLAIDSNDYKRVKDSLDVLKISTRRALNSAGCYMIINDTLKVPLQVDEFFMGYPKTHEYWMSANIRFRKIKTMRLVTGNALLDSTLKNITFNRKSRIKFDFIGPGY